MSEAAPSILEYFGSQHHGILHPVKQPALPDSELKYKVLRETEIDLISHLPQ